MSITPATPTTVAGVFVEVDPGIFLDSRLGVIVGAYERPGEHGVTVIFAGGKPLHIGRLEEDRGAKDLLEQLAAARVAAASKRDFPLPGKH